AAAWIFVWRPRRRRREAAGGARHAARTRARAVCHVRDGDWRRRHRAGDCRVSPPASAGDVRLRPGDCHRRDGRAAEVKGMVMKHTCLAFHRDDRGAALIEMALTLPLMLLVSAGIFEFGRAYQTWQVLTNAAREGARIAVLPGTTDANITARVRPYISRFSPCAVFAMATVAGGTFAFATYRYVQNRPAGAAPLQTHPVVVAAVNLDVGAELRREDIKVIDWPAESVPAGTFSNPQDVVGRGLIQPVVQNAPVLAGSMPPTEAGAVLTAVT